MSTLPRTFRDFVKRYPDIWDAHERLAQACAEAGPLDRKTRELIKVGLSVGAGLETAAKRHTFMALEHGATADEVFQTVLMAMTTCGHPTAAAGWQWVREAMDGPRLKKSSTKRKR
jgi:4-carboxymuconolactone decarboxylase